VIAVQILTLLTLAVIFIQDLVYRGVYWILFPILAILLITLRLQYQPLADIVLSLEINLGVLLVEFMLLTLYFSVKYRRRLNLTQGWLCVGDLFFLAVCAIYLPLLNFMLFYLVSLIAVIIIWKIHLTVVKTTEVRIPLAGLQGLLLGIVLSVCWWVWHFNITADYRLVHFYYKASKLQMHLF